MCNFRDFGRILHRRQWFQCFDEGADPLRHELGEVMMNRRHVRPVARWWCVAAAMAGTWTVGLAATARAQSEPASAPARQPPTRIDGAPASEPQKDIRPRINVHLLLELEAPAPAELKPADVKAAAIPSGKRVGLSYTGVKEPESIARYTKMGFRTSIGVSAGASPEQIKALEDAGADLVCNGAIGPEMGLTPQEALDGSASIRLALLGKVRNSPVAIGSYNNMRNNFDLPTSRRVGQYLYAIHDSNFLACNSWAAGYKVIVGRNRVPEQIVREHNANSAGAAPNTLVYYQTLQQVLQGIVEMMSPGEVTSIALRDFKEEDFKKVEQFIGPFGKDERIWHTTQHEIAGYAYLKEKTRISAIQLGGGGTRLAVTLSMEPDVYVPFLTAPLCLSLPKTLKIGSARLNGLDCPVFVRDSGLYVDLPMRQALSGACQMSLAGEPSMTIPDSMPVTLTIKNASDKPLAGAKLRWVENIGMEIAGGEGEAFDLAGGAEKKVAATIKTLAGPRNGVKPKGARFGLAPVSAVITSSDGGVERSFAASWEIAVAPRLRVEVDPRGVPIAKDDQYNFYVHLANGRNDPDPMWNHRFSQDKFIHHKTGPCKGALSLKLPEGMSADPASQAFELPKDGKATLKFVVRNTQWGKAQGELAQPLIVLEGEKEPIELPWYGSVVMRNPQSEIKPLDDKGLLAYCSWDDKKNTRGTLDKASGSTEQSCPGATGGGLNPCQEGVKGWCVGWDANLGYDSWRNIDYHKGTVMFWVRRDPKVRNDIQTAPDPAESWKTPGSAQNFGEKLFCVGLDRDLILRRFGEKGAREGYLELVLREQEVRGRKPAHHYVQAAYEAKKLYDWRHVAIVWDVRQRRLELYIDGELKGKADPGPGEWIVTPWDAGQTTHCMLLNETHHGHWSGSMRDEFYVYNRPLAPEEIKANMELVKAK